MNATAKAITYGSLVSRPLEIILPFPGIKVFILCLMVLLSALSLVYLKDLNRRLFINSQNIQQTRTQLNTNYNNLLLEESTWSTQARVQSIAEQKLGMELPAAKNIVVVDLSKNA